ncbi:MAG TPA: response regulator [Gemmatimonadales bacterium]|nr:response regulator [Gemmatimonadales bacterium]
MRAAFSGRHILVADEDPRVVALIIRVLRELGHAVFHAYDGQSAVELALALNRCDLIVSNTRVDGLPGVDLIRQLRTRQPKVPILYIANLGRSTPEIESQLPADVPILREPFTAGELRTAVHDLIGGNGRPAEDGDPSASVAAT